MVWSGYAKRSKGDSYEEHFNKSFWYTLTSYLWGKPVQAIRDFNKLSRFGQAKADIPAADEIADEVQRAHSSTQRAESLVYGTDIVQDTSIMTGTVLYASSADLLTGDSSLWRYRNQGESNTS